MYSNGPPHMAVQKQDDQHEHTFSSYVRIRDVVLKTCLGQWTIGKSGERGSGISVLPARHDDDDDISKDLWLLLIYYYVRFSLKSEWQQVSSDFQTPWLPLCRNFGKELVILFHRTAAAPWGHMAFIIKKRSTGDSSSISTPTAVFVAALDDIRSWYLPLARTRERWMHMLS